MSRRRENAIEVAAAMRSDCSLGPESQRKLEERINELVTLQRESTGLSQISGMFEAILQRGTPTTNQASDIKQQLAVFRNRMAFLQELEMESDALQTIWFSDVSDSDAEISRTDPERGVGWIELGSKERLRRGDVFQVYRLVTGGHRWVKGFVEVRDVSNSVSQVAILQDLLWRDPRAGGLLRLPNPRDPITSGDLIQSSLFDREERQVFVLLGTALPDPSFDREEIERLIEEAGARVDPNVTIETDYAVALDGYDQDAAQYDTARQFGVVFVTLEELLDFLPRSGGGER